MAADGDVARLAIQEGLGEAIEHLSEQEIRDEVDYWFEIRAEDGE